MQQLKRDDSAVAEMIGRIEDSSFIVKITGVGNRQKGNVVRPEKDKNRIGCPQGSTIEYNPYDNSLSDGKFRHARVGLAHELGHADDFIHGRGILVDRDKLDKGDAQEILNKIKAETHPLKMENRVRHKLNLEERTMDDYLYGRK